MGKRKTTFCAEGCPVEAALDIIGGKWKGAILYHLLKDQRLRFNEIKRKLPEVSQRILIRQLRELEKDRVVIRQVYAEVPPRVEYSVSKFGLSLKPVIKSLETWGLQTHQL
jgi:DNA-binding HxlR family transcriptional regulator